MQKEKTSLKYFESRCTTYLNVHFWIFWYFFHYLGEKTCYKKKKSRKQSLTKILLKDLRGGLKSSTTCKWYSNNCSFWFFFPSSHPQQSLLPSSTAIGLVVDVTLLLGELSSNLFLVLVWIFFLFEVFLTAFSLFFGLFCWAVSSCFLVLPRTLNLHSNEFVSVEEVWL